MGSKADKIAQKITQVLEDSSSSEEVTAPILIKQKKKPETTEVIPFLKTEVVPSDGEAKVNRDVDEDYAKSRENLNGLLDVGNAALAKLVELADDLDSPRAYEVVAGMIKNLAEVSRNVMEIHEKAASLKNKAGSSEKSNLTQQIQAQNAIFVGTPNELAKIIKETKRD